MNTAKRTLSSVDASPSTRRRPGLPIGIIIAQRLEAAEGDLRLGGHIRRAGSHSSGAAQRRVVAANR